MASILIIDDEADMCEMLSEMIRGLGHTPVSAHTLSQGLTEVMANPYDIVFLDVWLPDGIGLDILPQIRHAPSKPEVIILTGHADMAGVETAIKCGAWDYIQKKDSAKNVLVQISRVIQYREELKKNQLRPLSELKPGNIVGNSPGMRKCFQLLAQAADNDVNVHLCGETGTGKELFARAIHENSARKDKNFVVADCASLPETLVESILFGHSKGAFTGADQKRPGLIALADGGTLFLDEIGELSINIQKVLLRVIQERRYRPVGSRTEAESDFRLISATNRDIDQLSDLGLFRKDLLFRLRGLVIHLPPLRERVEDIHETARYYLRKLCTNYKIRPKDFSPELLEMMAEYSWPGNVRELVRALESAISAAQDEPVLFRVHFPVHIRTRIARDAIEPAKIIPASEFGISEPYPKLRDILEQVESRYLKHLMEIKNGSVKEVSRITGLSRTRLYERLKKYGIRKKH